jgi:hypothetical protein
MANRLNKKRNSQWLNLVSDKQVALDDESESENDLDKEQLENEEESSSGVVDSRLSTAKDSESADMHKPAYANMQNAANTNKQRGISPVIKPTTNVVNTSRQSIEASGQPSNIARQIQLTNKSQLNPLLSGNADTSSFAKVALGSTDPYNDDIEDSIPGNVRNAQVSAVTSGKKTPERVLLETLGQANPAPNSVWKRLLYGAIQNAATISSSDSGATALGKVLGGAVARAIPQVDVAQQVETRKKRAIEDYKIQKTAADAEANRQAKQANIQLAQDRLNEQKERNKVLNQARLTRERRAQANVLLDNLSKLPKDDPDRERLAQQLKDEYSIIISSRLGEKVQPQAKRIRLYDAENKRYYYADEQGNPLKDAKGNIMIAAPGKEDDVSKSEAEASIAPINEGALMNQAINEARSQFSKDKSKKSDIANMNDAQILADPDYAPWVNTRARNLTAEAKANRAQAVSKARSSKKTEPSKVAPSSQASTQSFDARNYLRQ